MFKFLLAAALLVSSPLLLAADPTQPPRQPLPAAAGPSAPAPEPLRLQAILRSADSARAVINGQTLQVGDRVAGARLLSIGARSVRLERQGRRISLPLVPPLFPSRTP